MPMPLQLVAKVTYDFASSSFAATIEYDEEGYDVILRMEASEYDAKSSLAHVLEKCKEVRSRKGEMIPLRIQLILYSERLNDEFNQLQQSDNAFNTGHLMVSVEENLTTDIPKLFAFAEMHDGSGEVKIWKFRKKKDLVS
jgi:hypothetical protein